MRTKKLAYCETITAGPETPWHIRPVFKGVDTLSLCGEEIGWDLNTVVSVQSIMRLGSSVCSRCADEAYIWLLHERRPGLLRRVKNKVHL